ncbi:MAG: hypothetical protein KAI66_24595, partial [Lentisphaeria bacterium]|nr:hypothetical protein [Lentisphaeria bacterium]
FGKYACHELAFFVHQKDPAFFADVVKPYLANKRDKTFLDHWLLDADLTPYLTPWAYGRLNIFEQVLLARRLPAESAATKRHVQDLHDLIPPDAARFDHLFKTALGGSALEAEGELAEMDDVLDEELAAAPAKNERARKSIAAKPGAAAPPRPQVIMASGKDAKRGMAKKSKKFMIEVEKEVMEDALLSVAGDSDKNAESKRDMKRRAKMRQFFRSPDTTEEWAETNYYHVPIEKHLAALVTVNAFWRDFAAHTGEGPFLSANVAEASRSLTEVLLALGALALPFEAKPAAPVFDGPSMTIKPQSPLLVFHRQTRPSKLDAEGTKILIGQNFFDIADRYRHDGNRRLDKFVTAEFLAGRVYGCQIVVTNPTSTPREIDVLLQIPRGAMPVANGFYTRGVHLALGSYSTETYEYRFYFPQAGSFPQFPAHVGERGVLVASAAPFPFNVVGMLTKIDREAWEYVSQYSSVYEVIEFLQKHNIDRLNLDLIAFRMKERAFFGRVLGLLRTRRVYSPTLWSYGVMHNDAQALREFLPHTPFADQCGMALASPLLTLDPVARHRWQLKEYWPLINARAHRLGGKRTIMNRQFLAQYQSFLRWLAHKPALGNEDRLALVVYLLLQDRVEEALAEFADIKRGKQDARLQYDYLKAYLAFCQSDPKTARKVAKPHREHPVPRWRNLFGDILAQCDEIQGAAATVAADPEDRERRQNALADTEPTFDFEIEEREIRMTCRNLEALTVNYYRMDLELLFSRTPFVRDVSGQFAIIQPNRSDELKLKKSATRQEIPLPKEFRQANTMVEITAAGRAVSRAYYPHAMDVQLVETYGRLRIAGKDGGKPIPAAYVKVYTRRKDGTVKFYKDGYTDLRGRFDYASLSTSDLDHVERFSILILSRDNGSVVREAAPPKR